MAPPADADDLRIEHIAAQLEEAEQRRLTDDWIKGFLPPRRQDRPATDSPLPAPDGEKGV
jgi:hypothetical protein